MQNGRSDFLVAGAVVAVIIYSATPTVHAGGTLKDASMLTSGQAIPVGTRDGLGPLSASITQCAVGSAYVFGSAQPDIFVTGRGWNRTEKGRYSHLYLYPWVSTADSGAPVFGHPIQVNTRFTESGAIIQLDDRLIHGVWLAGAELVHTLYDVENHSFSEVERVALPELPRDPSEVTVLLNSDGSLEVPLGIGDGVASRPSGFGGRDARYRPFDGAGIWRGGFPYRSLYAVSMPGLLKRPAESPRLVSKTTKDVRHAYNSLAAVNLGPGHHRDIVAGSRYGGLHYYHNVAGSGLALEPRKGIVRSDGNAHRHPIVDPGPVAYPNPKTGWSDLVAGGEGALYYYQFTGAFTDQGNPVFEDPVPVLQQAAELYGGSLPVPNVVDWDGDGDSDIVSGNSEGRILLFENEGSNERPAFALGVPLKAGGRDIHIQPGYRLDIQGPPEARWGYTCPVVADWNGDGLPDILMSDSTARHTIYLNRGRQTEPNLDFGHPLYLDGLELQGTWRVKPGVAKLGNRLAYVALDGDDEFHLHWRVDDYNLEDGGKLRLDDGSTIDANFLEAGGTGRLKINLVDWDLDGVLDLLVGTPRHGSVPNPETGLPQSLGLPGSAVLFLRNVGTNQEPRFKFPELMKHRGRPIFLGQHSCGPAVADFGHPDGPDLIVGEESGRFIYYERKHLSH